ncbi:MAG: DUF4230 domain-containing protein [Flavobacteriales bacterium]|nr:DUF4230 domain-containing protein [Flavobacteriales bacterium]
MKRSLGLLLLLGISCSCSSSRARSTAPTRPPSASSDVLLERIRPVMKLVTVEGDFSELYTYTHADATFDWLKQFSPFQKKAILRVKATASIGYDLEGMGLVFDEASRTVRFTGMGRPQVLALSHDVDYYDPEEGSFNDFTAADHTRINAQAKQLIERKVAGSGLSKRPKRKERVPGDAFAPWSRMEVGASRMPQHLSMVAPG